MNLTKSDLQLLAQAGIEKETIAGQLNDLREGPAPLQIKGACTIDEGIKRVSDKQKKALIHDFDTLTKNKTVSRFTPASGAATRMFKHLFDPESNPLLVEEFLNRITDFAFYEELSKLKLTSNQAKINAVLSEQGLNYGQLPKALISFHSYGEEVRKAIDEQLVEGVKYINQQGESNFHFTISPEHKVLVKNHLSHVVPLLEKRFETKFNISFSTQAKSSDTVAINKNGEMVRNEDNQILLRPGGHGSLIHNLNAQTTDIVFIKNIDNVVRTEFQSEIIDYKKMLGALLVNLQHTVFEILRELEACIVSDMRLHEMVSFIKSELNTQVEANASAIRKALNRPIRVCGMVKNEGKAGGGPFWVNNSVQIVESAQMDMNNPEMDAILKEASHFNPVDLVCGMKDYDGNKFDLLEFIDPTTFFVSNKSYRGEEIKVLEHPGLWNGAMANWLTVFVEVPVSTFHPVKTVNDLLQKSHSGLS
tara:strand:+ start:49850 stop:51280 length:1431 start_codon:yes stop_codon:yes gene_type:complete